jgi:hypothetical protein
MIQSESVKNCWIFILEPLFSFLPQENIKLQSLILILILFCDLVQLIGFFKIRLQDHSLKYVGPAVFGFVMLPQVLKTINVAKKNIN